MGGAVIPRVRVSWSSIHDGTATGKPIRLRGHMADVDLYPSWSDEAGVMVSGIFTDLTPQMTMYLDELVHMVLADPGPKR